MRDLLTLKPYFRKYLSYLLWGTLFVVLSNYFRILAPRVTGFLIDQLLYHAPETGAASSNRPLFPLDWVFSYLSDLAFSDRVIQAALLVVLLAVISGIFMFLMRQFLIVMSRHIEFEQKNEIYAHYQRLDLSFYRSQSTGDLMNRISEDVSRVRMFTGPAVMYFINLAAVIGFSIYFMWHSNPRLTLVALCPLPVLAFAIYQINRRIQRKSETTQSLLSRLTSRAQESYSGIRVIRSYSQEQAMGDAFARDAESYRKHSLSLARTEAIYFPGMAFLIGISTLITLMTGAIDVQHQVPGASVGNIAEFMLYIQMLTFPVSAIGWTASMTQRAAVSQQRIRQFLSAEPAVQDGPNLSVKAVKGDLVLDQLSFTYPHTGIRALENLHLQVKPAQWVALVGRTGCGKSTLIQLLVRFFDPVSGSIRIGDTPISHWSLRTLRNAMAYVPQDAFLFSDTIRNNLLFGQADATAQDLEEALQDAGVYEDIMRFPQGLDTWIGERGITLSGGQKQRVSLARALLRKDAQFYLLDDCLSAVDEQTEKRIALRLQKRLAGKTVLMVTHRVLSHFTFDHIVVLEHGRIAEEGTHASLMALGGFYQKWATMQQRIDND